MYLRLGRIILAKWRHDCKIESAPLTPENLASYDAGLMAADHTRSDYHCLAAPARSEVANPNVLPGRQVAGRVTKV